MKACSIVNAAVSGITSRSFHTNWNDCNPMRNQRIDPKQRMIETYVHIHRQEQLRERLKGARILQVVTQY